MNSLFSKVLLEIGGTNVEQNSDMYGHKCYMENLLFTPQTLDKQLTAEGFILDTPGSFEAMDFGENSGNDGAKLRRSQLSGSRETDFMGELHCDGFDLPRLLLDNVGFRLTLHRAEDKFSVLAHDGTAKYKLIITKIALRLRAIELRHAVHQALTSQLTTQKSLYPMTKREVKYFVIHPNNTSVRVQGMFTGRVPKQIIFGLVEPDARTGSYTKNPFLFNHHNVNKVRLSLNNREIGDVDGIEPNYELFQYAQPYINLANNIGNKAQGLKFTMANFKEDFALYAYNLSSEEVD